MATPLAPFYNQPDQDIYTGGDHFIPQQYYRLGNFTPTVPTTETQQQGYGIPYTGAFTNSNVRRDNPNTGGFGTWGNLDESSAKQFNIDGNIVTGYKNLNSGLYQDEEGYNLQNLGLFKDDDQDAKYGGLFHNVSLKTIRKNPGIVKQFFERQDFEKQAELQNEINMDNRIANIERFDRPNTGVNTPGSEKGQSPTGGDVAGTPFADGGRIGFFKGAQADTSGPAGGKAMSPGTSTTGGTRHGGGSKGGNGHADKGWQTYAIEPTPDTPEKRGPELNISPIVNLEKRSDLFNDDTQVPVDIGLKARINAARIRANLNLRGIWDAEPEEINSLSDIKNQILGDPSISFNTQFGPIDVNAFKNKNIDAYGLRTNIGPLNLGYHDINSQKRGDISYSPNDNFNIGATTDFDNIDLGATYNKGPFTVGGTLDDEGKYNVGAELKYTFNNGGLVGIL